MKISIITVVFNGEKTIARALESIYAQRDVEVEHIVIDGASSDGTLTVLKQFQKNIATLISESDQGIYDAMNKGIKLATGEIIGILNADDYYAGQNILKKVCDQFKTQNVEAVFGDVEYFDTKNLARVTRLYRSSAFHPKKLARGVMPAHPALFLRREVYERYGLFNIGFKIAGDFDFIARIFKSGDLRYSYIPSTLTRMQNGGISTQGLRSTILLNQEILQSCMDNQISSSYVKLLSRYPRKFLEYLFKD